MTVGIVVINEISSGENAVSSDNRKLILPKCHSPWDCEKYKEPLSKSESTLKGTTVSNRFFVGVIPFNVVIKTSPPSEPLMYIPKLLAVDDE